MSYIGNAPVVIPVEKQISGVNVGTIVSFPVGFPAPAGYVKAGTSFSKDTYPALFNYLGSETAPSVDSDTVGDIKWFSNRSLINSDFIPADGQLVDNGVNLFPEMWDAIVKKKVPTVTEEVFNSTSSARGSYTEGDNASNFRVPDMNGKSANTLGSVFIRGDGANSAAVGTIQGDAIRNITGSWACRVPNNHAGYVTGSVQGSSGEGTGTAVYQYSTEGSNYEDTARYGYSFDVSRQVPTANEDRPINLAGCWAIRAKRSKTYYIKAAGFIENEGLAKIGGLVETDSVLQKQIDDLNAWPQTGTNGNGTWVKHKDGRLECTRRIFSKPTPFVAAMYTADLTRFTFPWEFPHPFKGDLPITSGDMRDNQSAGFFGGASVELDFAQMVYITPTFQVSDTTGVLRAVGRWK